jgi:hypothetical protein
MSHSRRKNRKKKRAYKSDEREEDQLTPTTENFQNKLALTSLKTENNTNNNMTINTNSSNNSSKLPKEDSELKPHSHYFCCHHNHSHGFDSSSTCEDFDENSDDPETAQKAEREYFANVIQAFLYYNDYTQQLITKMENDWNSIPEHHKRYNHNKLKFPDHWTEWF